MSRVFFRDRAVIHVVILTSCPAMRVASSTHLLATIILQFHTPFSSPWAKLQKPFMSDPALLQLQDRVHHYPVYFPSYAPCRHNE